jgi:hypothetical protein
MAMTKILFKSDQILIEVATNNDNNVQDIYVWFSSFSIYFLQYMDFQMGTTWFCIHLPSEHGLKLLMNITYGFLYFILEAITQAT